MKRASGAEPLVSIGLPVHNGANYLRKAADTILEQTYKRLELIISDNASTDATSVICAELAAKDSRIRVLRNDRNIGAAANYNKVFEAAQGRYFKWAAHDDVLAPTFVERAVAVLENDPSIVLCTSKTGRIDHAGEMTGSYFSDSSWDEASAAARFHSVAFTPHACVAVFGLIRRDDLANTPLIAPYVNSDRVLLAELALRGRLHELSDILFFRRDHPGSSLRTFPDHRQRVVWFDPSKSASLSFPEWSEVLGYTAAVGRTRLPLRQRARAWGTIISLFASRWRPLLADFKYAAIGRANSQCHWQILRS